jgi:hypothetical protein
MQISTGVVTISDRSFPSKIEAGWPWARPAETCSNFQSITILLYIKQMLATEFMWSRRDGPDLLRKIMTVLEVIERGPIRICSASSRGRAVGKPAPATAAAGGWSQTSRLSGRPQRSPSQSPSMSPRDSMSRVRGMVLWFAVCLAGFGVEISRQSPSCIMLAMC